MRDYWRMTNKSLVFFATNMGIIDDKCDFALIISILALGISVFGIFS